MSSLLKNFDLLASAPGGADQLRRLILELAVRGKLVSQNPADESADKLLERITAEKARLVKEGKIKASKPLPEIAPEEAPYELPKGWRWVRLGEITIKLSSGSTPLGGKAVYKTEGPLFLRSQNVWDSGLDLTGIVHIAADVQHKMLNTHVKPKDLLFNITGASIGRCAIVPDQFPDANVSQHVVIVRLTTPEMREFIHTVLISNIVQQTVQDVQVGVSREGLSIAKLQTFLLPLPPLAEQERIVAKVRELTEKLDAFAALATHRKAVRTAARGAALGALAAGESGAWKRAEKRFDLLVDDAEAVKSLRRTILELAVRGKLVGQDPADESADKLLERITAEKARLVKEGKIKAGKPLAEISQEEEPYELPKGWRWVRLGDLIALESGGTPTSGVSAYWDNGTIPWVSPKDMKVETLQASIDKITPKAVADTSLSLLPIGTMLIVVRGMILAKNVPVAVTGVPLTINQDMKAMLAHFLGIVPFLHVWFKGWNEEIKKTIERSSHGTCKLETEKLIKFIIPLPPLAEQERIVAKVKELMAVCDRLEAALEKRDEAARKYAEAAVMLT